MNWDSYSSHVCERGCSVLGCEQLCLHMSLLVCSVSGVTVSMVAFQAVDPGSTPGRRTLFFMWSSQ